MADFRHALPGLLRVSSMRPEGADEMKLQDQFNEFGFSAVDMPPIEVTLGMEGKMINSEQSVKVEVIEVKPEWNFSRLLKIAETLTPDF